MFIIEITCINNAQVFCSPTPHSIFLLKDLVSNFFLKAKKKIILIYPCVKSKKLIYNNVFIAFPGEPAGNLLVFKGCCFSNVSRQQHAIKIILPANYPILAPRVYFDFNLSVEITRTLDYIGQNNMLTTNTINSWNP